MSTETLFIEVKQRCRSLCGYNIRWMKENGKLEYAPIDGFIPLKHSTHSHSFVSDNAAN